MVRASGLHGRLGEPLHVCAWQLGTKVGRMTAYFGKRDRDDWLVDDNYLGRRVANEWNSSGASAETQISIPSWANIAFISSVPAFGTNSLASADVSKKTLTHGPRASR